MTDALIDGVGMTRFEMIPPDVRSPNRLGLARFDGVRLIAQLADETPSPGDAFAFTGAYRLRDGQDELRPQLAAVDGDSG